MSKKKNPKTCCKNERKEKRETKSRLGVGDGSESDTGTSIGYKVKSESKGPY